MLSWLLVLLLACPPRSAPPGPLPVVQDLPNLSEQLARAGIAAADRVVLGRFDRGRRTAFVVVPLVGIGGRIAAGQSVVVQEGLHAGVRPYLGESTVEDVLGGTPDLESVLGRGLPLEDVGPAFLTWWKAYVLAACAGDAPGAARALAELARVVPITAFSVPAGGSDTLNDVALEGRGYVRAVLQPGDPPRIIMIDVDGGETDYSLVPAGAGSWLLGV